MLVQRRYAAFAGGELARRWYTDRRGEMSRRAEAEGSDTLRRAAPQLTLIGTSLRIRGSRHKNAMKRQRLSGPGASFYIGTAGFEPATPEPHSSRRDFPLFLTTVSLVVRQRLTVQRSASVLPHLAVYCGPRPSPNLPQRARIPSRCRRPRSHSRRHSSNDYASRATSRVT